MQSVDLAPDEKECLEQLFFRGPTWDGDLVSKAGRTGLVSRGYAERCNGWQQLTSAGFELAVRAGLGDDKERWDNRSRRHERDCQRVIVALLREIGGSYAIGPTDELIDLHVTRNIGGGVVRFAINS